MRVLIVVDMQNDFIRGGLGIRQGVAILPSLADYVEAFDGQIIFTRASHNYEYRETPEGKRRPVPHCIVGTAGHEINADIITAANANIRARECNVHAIASNYTTADCIKNVYNSPAQHSKTAAPGNTNASDNKRNQAVASCDNGYIIVDKTQFGSQELVEIVKEVIPDVVGNSIELAGICTDICIVSYAILLKAAYHNASIVVIEECCAGTRDEMHRASVEVMESCQIEIFFKYCRYG